MGTKGMQFTRKTLRPAGGAKDGTRTVTSLAMDPAEFHELSAEAFAAGLSLRQHIRVLIREARAARASPQVAAARSFYSIAKSDEKNGLRVETG